MTNFARKIGAYLIPAAALSLSGLGLVSGNAAESDAEDDALPMQCQISVSKDRFGHTFKGLLKATETVQGFYELNLAQRGNNHAVISQAGDFHVKAGDTQILGQATLGGMSLDSVEAELILHVNGKKYTCGTQTET